MSAPATSTTDTEVSPEDAPVSASAEAAAQQAASAEKTVSAWTDQLAATVRERPYTSLAVAAGVGYVAAAGVPSFLLRAMAGQGMKLATGALVGALVSDEVG